MTKEKQTTTASVQQLSRQIEILQNGLRRFSQSATLNDLGKRFLDILREFYPDHLLQIAYKTDDVPEWEWLGQASTDRERRLNDLLTKYPDTASMDYPDSNCIYLVQKLNDAVFLGLTIEPKRAKIEVANLNVVSCRIFLRLFDYAYRDMLFRKNEKALVFSLNQRILQLNSLIDTGIEVAKLHHNESPHHLALTRAASITNAARGIVRVKSGNTTVEEFTFPAGIEIDLSFDNACRITSTFAFMEKSFLFELFDKESRSGIVPFEETDQLLLDALAKQVHASMENRYLLDQALEKQRIEQEMTVAASIQQKILPVALPALPGYDIAGLNIPSKSVGGDYYDCIPLQNGTFAIIVADVTGKGVPAALLVSSLHAYLLAYLEESFSLPELAARLNKSLYRDSTEDKFVTAFIGIIDPANGEIECLSAGHNPAYVLRTSGHVDELNIGGPPLGIIDIELLYQSTRITLGKGERLLLYTDGVTEALNEKNELFEDYYSLQKYLSLHRADDAETFIDKLIAEIKKFSASVPQSDDITIIYLRRL